MSPGTGSGTERRRHRGYVDGIARGRYGAVGVALGDGDGDEIGLPGDINGETVARRVEVRRGPVEGKEDSCAGSGVAQLYVLRRTVCSGRQAELRRRGCGQ